MPTELEEVAALMGLSVEEVQEAGLSTGRHEKLSKIV
jgi:hypothetical protein